MPETSFRRDSTPTLVFFYEFGKIFKSTFFTEQPQIHFFIFFLLSIIASMVVRAAICFKLIFLNNERIIIEKEPVYGRKLPQTNTNV